MKLRSRRRKPSRQGAANRSSMVCKRVRSPAEAHMRMVNRQASSRVEDWVAAA